MACYADDRSRSHPAVEAVSTASPVEDFRAMLKNGKHDAAFDGMPRVISALVKKSIGDRCGA